MSTASGIKTQETARYSGALTWTVERVDLLAERWKAGDSARECAAVLGVSKNAAIGKLMRLGLLGPAAKSKPANNKPKPTRKTAFRPPPEQPPGVPDAAPIAAEPSDGVGIQLLDLTNETCRWPKGTPGHEGFCFCGKPGADFIGGRPYCAPHNRKAHQ